MSLFPELFSATCVTRSKQETFDFVVCQGVVLGVLGLRYVHRSRDLASKLHVTIYFEQFGKVSSSPALRLSFHLFGHLPRVNSLLNLSVRDVCGGVNCSMVALKQ